MPEVKLYRDRNLQIIFAVTLIAVMSVSSITPAFPSIMRYFDVTPAQIGLLITFFTLPGVLLAPVTGVLADRYGRKRILVPSLFLFAVAGVSSAFVRDFNLLLMLRVFQGLGAASLGSLNLTIIGDLYSGPQRTAAMGLNASVLSIGTASYPAIGGALALIAWYYPFFLPILAVPVGLVVMTMLKSPVPESEQNLKEYLGNTWRHLRNMKVLGLLLASTITFILIYGTLLTYFTLLLDERFSASSFTIGLMITSMSLITAVVSWQLGKINRILSLTQMVIIAFILYGFAFVFIAVFPQLWLMIVPMALIGAGHGVNIPSLQTSIAGLAPLEYRAAFMSVNATVLRLGQTIGPPLMALIYVNHGLNITFYVSAAIALMTAVIAFSYGQAGKSRKKKL
jgi:ACDE family multidrug resistance protein